MNKNSFLRYRFTMQTSCGDNGQRHAGVTACNLIKKQWELQKITGMQQGKIETNLADFLQKSSQKANYSSIGYSI